MAAREYEIPEEFLEAADRFVTLANELGDGRSADWVRAVMMYAAARYNAFNWLTADERTHPTIEQAAVYFRNEYETMFVENVKELEPVYRAAREGKAQ
jgi:Protein of unknown function (DUF3144)